MPFTSLVGNQCWWMWAIKRPRLSIIAYKPLVIAPACFVFPFTGRAWCDGLARTGRISWCKGKHRGGVGSILKYVWSPAILPITALCLLSLGDRNKSSFYTYGDCFQGRDTETNGECTITNKVIRKCYRKKLKVEQVKGYHMCLVGVEGPPTSIIWYPRKQERNSDLSKVS